MNNRTEGEWIWERGKVVGTELGGAERGENVVGMYWRGEDSIFNEKKEN